MLIPLFLALILTSAATTLAASNPTYLRATALITNAQNNSALQCWQFKSPASVSSDAGTSGSATFAFPHTNETIYTVIPPRFDGGTHRAPVAQYVTQARILSLVQDGLCRGQLLTAGPDSSSSYPAWRTFRSRMGAGTAV